MGSGVSFKVDRSEFDRTLKRYREFSKRDPATICNTKAFYIARRATVETPKANRGKVERSLLKNIVTDSQIIGQRFRFVNGAVRRGQMIRKKFTAPLAALILNARRGAKGEPGLYGAAMKDAVQALLGIRMKSIAFLKSGWLPAIKRLEPLAEKIGGRVPRQDRVAAEVGQAKGSAQPAQDGFWVAKAIITNSVEGRHGYNQEALIEFGTPALQRAFDAEAASMREYIERKMKGTAQRAGIRTS